MISRGHSTLSLFSDAASSRQARASMSSFDFSKHSGDDLDDWDELGGDEDDDDDEEGKTLREKIMSQVLDYGPPYAEDSGGSLIMEVAGPMPALSKVHFLLLNGANPNEHDKDDVGLTPMHYAARFGLTSVLRLFKHAGGDANVVNDFGQSALVFALLFVAKVDRRKKQLQAVNLLCEMGANPNAIDRGGFTPLAYAARNNDTACVRILLKHGGKVLRRYTHLNIPYQNPLDLTTNETCRALLQVQAASEQQAEDARREKQRLRQEELNRIMRAKALEDEKAERRRQERLDKLREKTEKFNQWKAQLRRERFEQEMLGRSQQIQVVTVKNESWVRSSSGGGWKLQQGAAPRSQRSYTDECNKQLEAYKKRGNYETLNKRWKELTGGELDRKFARASLLDGVEAAHDTPDLDEDITNLGDIGTLLEQARTENASAR